MIRPGPRMASRPRRLCCGGHSDHQDDCGHGPTVHSRVCTTSCACGLDAGSRFRNVWHASHRIRAAMEARKRLSCCSSGSRNPVLGWVRQHFDVGSGPEGKRHTSGDVYSPGNWHVGQWAALQLTDSDGAIENGENATRINPKQNGKARSSEQPSGDRVFLHGSFKALKCA